MSKRFTLEIPEYALWFQDITNNNFTHIIKYNMHNLLRLKVKKKL